MSSVPVINDVEIIYVDDRGYKLPGEPAEIIIHATDADAVTYEVTLKVTDSTGNVATQAVMVVQGDPLTYEATSEDPNVQITQDPSQPNHFYIV